MDSPKNDDWGGAGSPPTNPKHVSEDQCLELIHNLLPEAERDAHLAHLSSCATCETRFRSLVTGHERRTARHRLVRDPSGHFVLEPALPVPTEDRSLAGLFRRRRTWGFTFGAVAAAALLLLWLLPDRGLRDHRLQWLPAVEKLQHVRAEGGGALDADLLGGLDAYGRRDMPRAIRLLSTAQAQPPYDQLRQVYLSSALAWRGDYTEAAEILAPLPLESIPDPWGAEAMWTLYIAWRECDRFAEAESLLHHLREMPGGVGARAQAEDELHDD